MTWLTPIDGEPVAATLRRMLDDDGQTIPVPGVFDGLTALLAASAGARALYLSGAALSASMGMPDVGLLTQAELVHAVRTVARAVRVPTIVDADTGFGGPLNVMRTVRELETAGAAAVQLEDQEDPKRCGHLQGKIVTSPDRMVEKIRAAAAARREVLLVARTDARATDGFDEAVSRGRAYRRAGAEVIFPEALETEDEFGEYADAVGGALLANMTEFGRSPSLPTERLGELGYRIVIFPVSAARVAAKQVRTFYADLLREGATAWVDKMLTREELYDLIGYDEYGELDRSLSRRSEPAVPPDADG